MQCGTYFFLERAQRAANLCLDLTPEGQARKMFCYFIDRIRKRNLSKDSLLRGKEKSSFSIK